MTLQGWPGATGALALALILSLAWGMRVDHLRARHAAALAQARQDYRAAQDKAQADFDAQVAALRVHNRRLNDAAEQKSEALTLVYRDRVVRLPAAPATCAATIPGLPAPRDAQPVDRSGRDPILFDRADALICATNTARLEAARAWALEMQTGP
ncbi:hypothetical protein M2333_000455 [Sphingobium sp. B11D3B]|uniref:hypothetical protein n=1 Tax=Sphingobium sp. B11D3B TaxID=2940575 RepID=UPI0022261326|nr:hypothetical protein [Sphingobium sp. B11D3B]MCW2387409.1 hypothetical protein [Sphingobium sp. B11D3B]